MTIINYYFPANATGPNIRDVTATASTVQLLPSDGELHVNNTSGGNVAIVPPAASAPLLSGYRARIKDVGGNAGSHPITFQGVLDGQTNPTLIDVDRTWAEIEYWQGAWYRIA